MIPTYDTRLETRGQESVMIPTYDTSDCGTQRAGDSRDTYEAMIPRIVEQNGQALT